MNDYVTDQFLIVRYPNGAGGKFLIASLMMFEQIAHWIPRVQYGIWPYIEWFESAWPEKMSSWVTQEPNQPWNLDFYSRRWFRNNDQTEVWFNTQVEKYCSKYFFECWDKNLIIIDHWHKKTIPKFFCRSRFIDINLPSRCLDTYKNFVRNKLFLYDQERQIIISTMDHPEYSWNSRTQQNTKIFKNQYEFPVKDYDSWFYEHLVQQHWVKPFIDPVEDDTSFLSLDFDQLLDVSGYIDIMLNLSDIFDQKLDQDLLMKMHTIWCSKSHYPMRF
jgi:hypothetical protein